MALFEKAVSTSAYLKGGFMGFAGSGKTRTATDVAIGLLLLLREKGLKEGKRPIYFLDTETGSDYIEHRVREAEIELYTAKTRAFADLLRAVDEAEQNGGMLIVDSVTHFWREFCETYQRRKNRKFLEFQDWNFLKTEWGRFTDRYVNSACHIIICGRAGFEYDHEKDEETGKKELIKAGVKMKTEAETGYEPSLLVYMEREEDVRTHVVSRVAHVLKDRFGVIDGKALCNAETKGPSFDLFLPHIQRLNLGGRHLGVDTSRTSDELIGEDGKTRWHYEKEQKAICLDEVKEEIQKMVPGQGAADKKDRADLLEKCFGTRSWTKVESLSLPQLKEGRNRIWTESRGHGYGVEPPAPGDDGGWVAADEKAAAVQTSGLELDDDRPSPPKVNAAEAAQALTDRLNRMGANESEREP